MVAAPPYPRIVVARNLIRTVPNAPPGDVGHAQGMNLTATAHSIPGSLRQDVLIDGQHRVFTDEPERLGGEGSAPAPHELLPAAVAACVATSMEMYARTKGWELGDVWVDADYDTRSEPRRCTVTISVGADLTAEQIARLEKVARACPVRRSLEDGVRFAEKIAPRGARPSDVEAA